jgi:uncharacterized protein (TIGR02284 family)
MPTTVSPLVLTGALAPVAKHPGATALAALYDRSVDSVKGFATMVDKAQPSFRATAARFRALHASHVGRLAGLLADRGAMPDSDGSAMGTVNQAVVSFRAFFDDIDEDVMDQVRSGEDWVLKAFDAAIAEQPEAAAPLHAMRAELTDLLVETQDLG